MLINAYTKEFTLTNNAFLSYVIAFEHLLYYKMVGNVFKDIDNIFLKHKDIIHFNLSIVSFQGNLKFSQ